MYKTSFFQLPKVLLPAHKGQNIFLKLYDPFLCPYVFRNWILLHKTEDFILTIIIQNSMIFSFYFI